MAKTFLRYNLFVPHASCQERNYGAVLIDDLLVDSKKMINVTEMMGYIRSDDATDLI